MLKISIFWQFGRTGLRLLFLLLASKVKTSVGLTFCCNCYNCWIASAKKLTAISLCRRGEEHSFILRPVNPILKSSNGHSGKTFRSSRVHSRSASSSWHHLPIIEERNIGSPTDKYAVLVSCRCNYTGRYCLKRNSF